MPIFCSSNPKPWGKDFITGMTLKNKVGYVHWMQCSNILAKHIAMSQRKRSWPRCSFPKEWIKLTMLSHNHKLILSMLIFFLSLFTGFLWLKFYSVKQQTKHPLSFCMTLATRKPFLPPFMMTAFDDSRLQITFDLIVVLTTFKSTALLFSIDDSSSQNSSN